MTVLSLASITNMTANPHTYTKNELSDSELLASSKVIAISGAEERGLFVGIYKKSRFTDMDAFSRFVTNISSLTQIWYSTGDLDEALEWYVPDYTQIEWIKDLEKSRDSVRDFILSRFPTIDSARLPANLDGTFWIYESDDGFQIVGASKDLYFEVFTAELIP